MKNLYFLILVILLGCKKSEDTIIPQVKSLREAVYASGYVLAADEYEVNAQVEGYLAEKLVQDNDLVKRGDPLFIIEDNQQSARFNMAKETYALALRNYQEGSPVLRELKAAVESAKTKKKFDSLNYVRFTNLLQNKATSQSEFDRMKLAYENSSNEYALQFSRFERTKNQLYLDLQNAKNQLQIAGDESGKHIIRSQMDGKVFRTMKDKGELVRRYETVAVVGNDEAFYVQLSVDELDIQRVKPGQDIVVKIDAYPDKVFRARVEKIFPMINQQQQSVRVDASFQDTLPAAFSGLAVEANIIIRQKENALVIPKTALLPGDSVILDIADGEKKIKVVRGIETLDEVEILHGIDSANRLIVIR